MRTGLVIQLLTSFTSICSISHWKGQSNFRFLTVPLYLESSPIELLREIVRRSYHLSSPCWIILKSGHHHHTADMVVIILLLFIFHPIFRPCPLHRRPFSSPTREFGFHRPSKVQGFLWKRHGGELPQMTRHKSLVHISSFPSNLDDVVLGLESNYHLFIYCPSIWNYGKTA